MNKILDWLKNNKAVAASVVAILLVAVGAMSMQGCKLTDFVKHDVPKPMQSYSGSPKVTLTQSPAVREEYVAEVERCLRQYDTAAQDAAVIYDIFNSAVTLGLEELGSSAVPGAGLLIALLTGVAGLYTPKPGSSEILRKEKEASYNAGQEHLLSRIKEINPGMSLEAAMVEEI